MGTLVSLTAFGSSPDQIEAAFESAFHEMDRVVALLNRYDERSPLAHLNCEGTLRDAPVELAHVVESALWHYARSSGVFDVTVQPLVDLFQARGSPGTEQMLPGARPARGTVPGLAEASDSRRLRGHDPDAEVATVLELIDGKALRVSGRSLSLEKAGMGVTLDGIAKGYVVDRMAAVLSSRGVTDWLIDAGGDIRTSGQREDGHWWRIGVQDPRKRGDLPDVIALSGSAVATSGSYEAHFDSEATLHHIVDSTLGGSPHSCQSASVVAPTALAADALATTVFILGAEAGIPYIDSLPGCACLIVDAQGEQRRSRRWRSAP
jgi:thiamine biosynthesis lipoprotein